MNATQIVCREVPPFQDVLAQMGEVSVRYVSTDLRSAFDAGLCRAWTNLKDQAKDLKFLCIFMDKIEKNNGGLPTKENSFFFFKELKSCVDGAEAIKGVVHLNPVGKLLMKVDCFQLGGPRYVRDGIPEEIQKKASRIKELKVLFGDGLLMAAPEGFHCLYSLGVMTIPVFDASHPHVQDLWSSAKEGGSAPNNFSIFQAMDSTVVESTVDNVLNSLPGYHSIQSENLVIHAVLQDEILRWLEDRSSGV